MSRDAVSPGGLEVLDVRGGGRPRALRAALPVRQWGAVAMKGLAVVGLALAVLFLPTSAWAEGETGTPTPTETAPAPTTAPLPPDLTPTTDQPMVTVTTTVVETVAVPTTTDTVKLDADQFGVGVIVGGLAIFVGAASLVVQMRR